MPTDDKGMDSSATKVNALVSKKEQLVLSLDTHHLKALLSLENTEKLLKQKFKGTSSEVLREHIVRQILEVRQGRVRANQLRSITQTQLKIISSYLHNLQITSLIQDQELPDIAEINRAFVNVEENLMRLKVLSGLTDRTDSTQN